jgi:Ca2+-binding RTX toxin-like protein
MKRKVSRTILGVAIVVAVQGSVLAGNPISCPGGVCNGTTGDDQMTGTGETDYMYAMGGNDTLLGLGSYDDLRGGPGDDRLDGGRGNDQYNTYEYPWGTDVITGDAGGSEDWLIFHIGPNAVTIDLVPRPGVPEVSSGASTINIRPKVVIEWVQAGPLPDIVKGNDAENYLSGLDGGDRLLGRGGADTLRGDAVVFGDIGNDVLKGDRGGDDLDGGPGYDDLYGGKGDDRLKDIPTGGAEDPDYDNVYGGPGNDRINVKDGDPDDLVCPGPGDDTVRRDAGDEVNNPAFC